MMVVMALVTTFVTTPLVSIVYPPSLYKTHALSGTSMTKVTKSPSSLSLPGLIPDGNKFYGDGMLSPSSGGGGGIHGGNNTSGSELSILVVLPSMQSVPAMMALVQMLNSTKRILQVHALRLIEMTERTSAFMMAADSTETMNADPVMNIFRTFGQLNRVGVHSLLAVTSIESFSENVVEKAGDVGANFIVIPWQPSGRGKSGGKFLFKDVLFNAPCSVGLFIDRGFGVSTATENTKTVSNAYSTTTTHSSGISHLLNATSSSTGPTTSLSHEQQHNNRNNTNNNNNNNMVVYPGQNQHVLVPFGGGKDDREAVLFVLNLAEHLGISVTVLHIKFNEESYRLRQQQRQQELQEEMNQPSYHYPPPPHPSRSHPPPHAHSSITSNSFSSNHQDTNKSQKMDSPISIVKGFFSSTNNNNNNNNTNSSASNNVTSPMSPSPPPHPSSSSTTAVRTSTSHASRHDQQDGDHTTTMTSPNSNFIDITTSHDDSTSNSNESLVSSPTMIIHSEDNHNNTTTNTTTTTQSNSIAMKELAKIVKPLAIAAAASRNSGHHHHHHSNKGGGEKNHNNYTVGGGGDKNSGYRDRESSWISMQSPSEEDIIEDERILKVLSNFQQFSKSIINNGNGNNENSTLADNTAPTPTTSGGGNTTGGGSTTGGGNTMGGVGIGIGGFTFETILTDEPESYVVEKTKQLGRKDLLVLGRQRYEHGWMNMTLIKESVDEGVVSAMIVQKHSQKALH